MPGYLRDWLNGDLPSRDDGTTRNERRGARERAKAWMRDPQNGERDASKNETSKRDRRPPRHKRA